MTRRYFGRSPHSGPRSQPEYRGERPSAQPGRMTADGEFLGDTMASSVRGRDGDGQRELKGPAGRAAYADSRAPGMVAVQERRLGPVSGSVPGRFPWDLC